MATFTAETPSLTGTTPTYNAANAGGDRFTPTKRTWLHVKNDDASAHTVTVTTPKTFGGLAIDDVAVSVPAGEERVIGPFDPELFDSGDGLADITYDAVTSVTVAVLRI